MLTACYIALLICLLLIALFAASEAALAATNRMRLRHLLRAQASPDESNAAQQLSSELSSDAQQFIATVTIAANAPLLGAAVLTVWLARYHYNSTPTAALICVGAALAIIALFQITPRLLVSQPGALQKLWWVRPARLFVALLRPPVALLMKLGSMLLTSVGLLSNSATSTRGAEAERNQEDTAEILDLVESAHSSGVIEESGKELIESIFTFGDTRVHEVMIPRPDILALPVESSANQILDTLQESGYSRIPLYEDSIDKIVGILHAKDVLVCLNRNERDFAPRTLMRPPLFLPESQKIDEALAMMRAQRMHLCIVIDEFGGTAGLLTVEDILEELVGDIADEHDRKIEDPLVIVDEHTALVDALLHTDDLEERWNLSLPTGEFDTVGGFMIEQLGRAPIAGDRVEVPNATLAVHSMRGRRLKQIKITRKEEQGSGVGV
ncbi:MAG: HlyC/CorC family transporter [Abitibacteriaceae bacterium]|nr:HlyC/CorC family transporter [Abditibacteriaceae bacterium]